MKIKILVFSVFYCITTFAGDLHQNIQNAINKLPEKNQIEIRNQINEHIDSPSLDTLRRLLCALSNNEIKDQELILSDMCIQYGIIREQDLAIIMKHNMWMGVAKWLLEHVKKTNSNIKKEEDQGEKENHDQHGNPLYPPPKQPKISQPPIQNTYEDNYPPAASQGDNPCQNFNNSYNYQSQDYQEVIPLLQNPYSKVPQNPYSKELVVIIEFCCHEDEFLSRAERLVEKAENKNQIPHERSLITIDTIKQVLERLKNKDSENTDSFKNILAISYLLWYHGYQGITQELIGHFKKVEVELEDRIKAGNKDQELLKRIQEWRKYLENPINNRKPHKKGKYHDKKGRHHKESKDSIE